MSTQARRSEIVGSLALGAFLAVALISARLLISNGAHRPPPAQDAPVRASSTATPGAHHLRLARHDGTAATRLATSATRRPAVAPPGGRRVASAPVTVVAPATPVQQAGDEGFRSGFSSRAEASSIARAEQVARPAPRVFGGWPRLSPSESPEAWARAFTAALLDLDFAERSRAALAAFLAEEEAPDDLPGIPAGLAGRTLVVSLLHPEITGTASPVPSRATWEAYAAERLSLRAGDLEVGVDPSWQSLVATGWEPPDPRAVVLDVSGVLVVSGRGASSSRRFSMVLQLGSAAHHPGYGTVLVSHWQELS